MRRNSFFFYFSFTHYCNSQNTRNVCQTRLNERLIAFILQYYYARKLSVSKRVFPPSHRRILAGVNDAPVQSPGSTLLLHRVCVCVFSEGIQTSLIVFFFSFSTAVLFIARPFLVQVIFSQSSELLERHSSMASSTEEVSAPDVSVPSDSRKEREDQNNADHFGTVFKDFDFLEYESESVEVSACVLQRRGGLEKGERIYRLVDNNYFRRVYREYVEYHNSTLEFRN